MKLLLVKSKEDLNSQKDVLLWSIVGGLQGEGVLQELKCYLSDGSATVYGLERITGCIDGKSGSLVLVHAGRYENGVLTSRRKVVNGSGTGEWRGMFGEINFESGSAEQFTITFDYYIE